MCMLKIAAYIALKLFRSVNCYTSFQSVRTYQCIIISMSLALAGEFVSRILNTVRIIINTSSKDSLSLLPGMINS
jgi:hypothetical protein